MLGETVGHFVTSGMSAEDRLLAPGCAWGKGAHGVGTGDMGEEGRGGGREPKSESSGTLTELGESARGGMQGGMEPKVVWLGGASHKLRLELKTLKRPRDAPLRSGVPPCVPHHHLPRAALGELISAPWVPPHLTQQQLLEDRELPGQRGAFNL